MKPKRNYHLLLWSQFLSAFGDNAILQVILGPLMKQLTAGRITAHEQSLDNIYFTSLLFVPYVLLAPLAGYLNDRFANNRWLLGGNLIKLAGTALTLYGVTAGTGWQGFGYFVVGIGACMYSPAKYGILPEILPAERLVKANGMVELLTLVAILIGTVAGASMSDYWQPFTCYAMVASIYGASALLNCFMSKTPAYPDIRLAGSVVEFFKNCRDLLRNRRLARVLLGTSTFWICGAMVKMNSQPWGQQVLKLETMLQISLLGLWLSLGLMAGSVLAGQLYGVGDLRATRRYGWLLAVAVAVLGGTAWFTGLGLTHPQWVAVPALVFTGLVGGLFLIPLNAALQAESHQAKLGKTIATQNGFENLAMLAGSVYALINVNMGFDPSQLFLCLAVFVGVVVIWLKIPITNKHE